MLYLSIINTVTRNLFPSPYMMLSWCPYTDGKTLLTWYAEEEPAPTIDVADEADGVFIDTAMETARCEITSRNMS